jgi:hypothetical protein
MSHTGRLKRLTFDEKKHINALLSSHEKSVALFKKPDDSQLFKGVTSKFRMFDRSFRVVMERFKLADFIVRPLLSLLSAAVLECVDLGPVAKDDYITMHPDVGSAAADVEFFRLHLYLVQVSRPGALEIPGDWPSESDLLRLASGDFELSVPHDFLPANPKLEGHDIEADAVVLYGSRLDLLTSFHRVKLRADLAKTILTLYLGDVVSLTMEKHLTSKDVTRGPYECWSYLTNHHSFVTNAVLIQLFEKLFVPLQTGEGVDVYTARFMDLLEQFGTLSKNIGEDIVSAFMLRGLPPVYNDLRKDLRKATPGSFLSTVDKVLLYHNQNSIDLTQGPKNVNSTSLENVCWQFQKGKCSRGDKCNFSHPSPGNGTTAAGATRSRSSGNRYAGAPCADCTTAGRADRAKTHSTSRCKGSEFNKQALVSKVDPPEEKGGDVDKDDAYARIANSAAALTLSRITTGTAVCLNSSRSNDFVIHVDSCANLIVVPDLSMLVGPKPVGDMGVKQLNGRTSLTHVGGIIIPVVSRDDNGRLFRAVWQYHEAFYSPDCSDKNMVIVPLRYLTRMGFSWDRHGEDEFIFYPSSAPGDVAGYLRWHNDLLTIEHCQRDHRAFTAYAALSTNDVGSDYILNMRKAKLRPRYTDVSVAAVQRFHERMAHASVEVLLLLIKYDCAEDLEVTQKEVIAWGDSVAYKCLGCLLGRYSRGAKATSTPNQYKATHAMDSWSIDIGQFPIGLGGHRYILAVVDEATAYKVFGCLVTKSAAAVFFKTFYAKSRNRHDRALGRLTCDNDGVFTSKDFLKLLDAEGVAKMYTNVASSFKNPYAENAIGLCKNSARVSLKHANPTPTVLWPLIVPHLSMVDNWLPLRRMIRGDELQSPWHVWHGTKPTVKYLRVPFCRTMVKVNNRAGNKGSNSLDDTAYEGFYVGNGFDYKTTVNVLVIAGLVIRHPSYHDCTFIEDEFMSDAEAASVVGQLRSSPTFNANEQYLDPSWDSPEVFDSRPEVPVHDVLSVPVPPLAGDVPMPMPPLEVFTPVALPALEPATPADPGPVSPSTSLVSPIPFGPLSDSQDLSIFSPALSPFPSVSAPEGDLPSLFDPYSPLTNVLASPGTPPSQAKTVILDSPPPLDVALPAVPVVPLRHSKRPNFGRPNPQRTENALVSAVCPEEHSRMLKECLAVMTEESQFTDVPDVGPDLDFSAISSGSRISFGKARASKQWASHKDGMLKMLKALCKHESFRLTPLPEDVPRRDVIKPLWVGCVKYKRVVSDGRTRYVKVTKWRLAARGDMQRDGINVNRTHSGAVKEQCLFLLFALIARRGMYHATLDAPDAYLQGNADVKLYMAQPQGFVDPLYPDHVWEVLGNIQGVRQAGRIWGFLLDDGIRAMGFQQSVMDPCLWWCWDPPCPEYDRFEGLPLPPPGSTLTLLVTNVDDIAIASDSPEMKQKYIDEFVKAFNVLWHDNIEDFVGYVCHHDRVAGTFSISQTPFIDKMAKMFRIQISANMPKVPLPLGMKLTKDECPKNSKDKAKMIKYPFRTLVGGLRWALKTRKDACFVVAILSTFLQEWGMAHWKAGLYCLRYLVATRDLCIQFTRDSHDEIVAWVDSNYNLTLDGRSLSAFLVQYAGGLVAGASTIQRSPSQSTTEAEFYAAVDCANCVIFLREVLTELGLPPKGPTVLYEDNTGCIVLADHPVAHSRTRHIQRRYFVLRHYVATDQVVMVYCPTEDQLADLLSKSLASPQFIHLRNRFMARDPNLVRQFQALMLCRAPPGAFVLEHV